MLQKWLILLFGLGIWIVDRFLSSSSLTESLFLVDTLALVRKLEGQGVVSNQPEAITTAITQVLNESFENVSHSCGMWLPVANCLLLKVMKLLFILSVLTARKISMLFSCGTSKDGETFLVEWNESEGSIKRIYQGLQTCLASPVLFVTIKNQFLVAGDDHMIKFWNMDNSKILRATDAEGGLPVTPRICINKEGTLLA